MKKHGDATKQDCWASTELDNFLPTRKGRAVEVHFLGDKSSARSVLWLHN